MPGRAGRPRTTPEQHPWIASLFTDPVLWNGRQENFTNGQHRTCALRAAGAPAVPAAGRYLPSRPYPAPVEATQDASVRVAAFWRARADSRYGHLPGAGWWAAWLASRAAA
ncbi:hypothetical protein [Streptodolium elevatio]|uniref:Uncharacterized protein n=1 Tax=Streptodolium elevatio TaxID=3157996 RepID=A0ABV3DKP5_9ACTN